MFGKKAYKVIDSWVSVVITPIMSSSSRSAHLESPLQEDYEINFQFVPVNHRQACSPPR